MKLIADSGSTKTDWACIDDAGKDIRFLSAGYNPNYITEDYMVNDIRSNVPTELDVSEVNEIYFYGAGVTELQFAFVRESLKKVFHRAEKIFVAMDMLGSAHALLGHQPGFSVILGTGTNSCLYDGKKVVKNIDSLGFILGDEGSGAYLGKCLIRDYIREDMPRDVYDIVKNELKLNGDELIDIIYTKPFPNRFCAQYAKFISCNIEKDNYFYRLVLGSFRALFEKIISHYDNFTSYEFNCVGSIGYCFQNILSLVVHEYGMEMGKLIRYPIDGLVSFYRNKD